MSISKIRTRLSFVGLLAGTVLAAPAHAQTSGDNGSHDPSRMIESNGKVYIYSTGGGAKASVDGLVWKDVATPAWNRNLVANNQGIWAPDGIYLNGQYLLYGSMWSADKSSALVLLTSPTLDPASAQYKWADKGVVVAGPVGVTHSVIDPAPVLDAQGNLWVSWGGGYPFSTSADSIFVTRLDNQTGLALTTDPGWKPPNSPGYAIAQGHKEGSYLYYHGGNYYLWYQTGSCCSGTSSTYTMHVARASAITGPYSGDRTFYASNSGQDIHGPGHIGIYNCGGVERFTYHYYPDNGSVIGENTLTWGSDGWPVAGAKVSSALKLPCAVTTSPAGGASAGGASAGGASAGGAPGGGVGNAGGGGAETGGASETDAGATGGAATANGGAPENGGSTSDAGTESNAGSAGSSAAPVAGSGGATQTAGGGSALGGSAQPAGAPDNAAAGCSCELSGRRGSNSGVAFSALAALALLGARRRRSGLR